MRMYKTINNETVGVGPKVYLDTKEVMSELTSIFAKQSLVFHVILLLLDHWKQAHSVSAVW